MTGYISVAAVTAAYGSALAAGHFWKDPKVTKRSSPHHSAPRLGSVCPHSGLNPWAAAMGHPWPSAANPASCRVTHGFKPAFGQRGLTGRLRSKAKSKAEQDGLAPDLRAFDLHLTSLCCCCCSYILTADEVSDLVICVCDLDRDRDLRRPVKPRWPYAGITERVNRQDAGLAATGQGRPVAAARGVMPAYGHTEPRRGAEWWGKSALVTLPLLQSDSP